MFINKLFSLFFIVFLSISPIYFLPFFDISFFNLFKWTLVIFLMFYSFFLNYGKNFFIPGGKNGMILIILFFLSTFIGIFQIINIVPDTSLDSWYHFYPNPLFILKEFLPQIIFFLISYNFIRRYHEAFNILYFCSAIFSIFIIYVFLANFISFLDIPNPFWKDTSVYHGFSLSNTGFNASRTNWNNAIAIFFPFIIHAFYFNYFKKNIFIFVIFILLLLVSMTLTAGRAGLISAIISIIIFSFFHFDLKKIFLILVVFVSVMFVSSNILYEQFKLKDLHNKKTIIQNQNFFSFRFISLLGAYKLIKDNPLGGYGVNKHFRRQMATHPDQDWGMLKLPEESGSQLGTIHNEFLRIYLSYGFFTFSFIISFLLLYLGKMYKLYQTVNNIQIKNYIIVCFSNLIAISVISFFGYYTFFGSFLNQNIFWASAGFFFGLYDISIYNDKK